MIIVCVDNTPIMLQNLKENAEKAYPYADVQTFRTVEPALEYAEKVGCDVRTVRRWISDFDSISNISYAAKALGKNVTDFLV